MNDIPSLAVVPNSPALISHALSHGIISMHCTHGYTEPEAMAAIDAIAKRNQMALALFGETLVG